MWSHWQCMCPLQICVLHGLRKPFYTGCKLSVVGTERSQQFEENRPWAGCIALRWLRQGSALNSCEKLSATFCPSLRRNSMWSISKVIFRRRGCLLWGSLVSLYGQNSLAPKEISSKSYCCHGGVSSLCASCGKRRLHANWSSCGFEWMWWNFTKNKSSCQNTYNFVYCADDGHKWWRHSRMFIGFRGLRWLHLCCCFKACLQKHWLTREVFSQKHFRDVGTGAQHLLFGDFYSGKNVHVLVCASGRDAAGSPHSIYPAATWP